MLIKIHKRSKLTNKRRSINGNVFNLNLVHISLGLLMFSLLLRIVYSGIVAVKNSELQDLYAQRDALQKEVSDLYALNSEISSLSYIRRVALSRGFIPMGNVIALHVGGSTTLALNR